MLDRCVNKDVEGFFPPAEIIAQFRLKVILTSSPNAELQEGIEWDLWIGTRKACFGSSVHALVNAYLGASARCYDEACQKLTYIHAKRPIFAGIFAFWGGWV